MKTTSLETNVPTIEPCRAGSGQVLHVLGSRMTTKTRCREANDAVFVSECTFPPGGGPPLPTHPQWETFYVLEGTVEFGFMKDGVLTTLLAHPGDVVTIPRDAPHGFKNVGDDWANMLVIGEPGFEAFFYDAGLGAREGMPTEAEIGRVVGVMNKHGQKVLGPHPEN